MSNELPQEYPAAEPAPDDAYTGQALARIRAAVRGNGLDPAQVHFENFTGHYADFGAMTTLAFNPTTTEKFTAGKKTIGEKVGGAQAALGKIEDDRKKSLRSADTLRQIRALVLERKDKGFGLRNTIIKLPFLSREYFYHDACRPCTGKGRIACVRCAGKGAESCPRCNGQAMEICVQCQGARLVHNGGTRQSCPRCSGQGRTSCSLCRQARTISCAGCRGNGHSLCQNCSGEGSSTHSYLAEMNVIASWDFDRAGMAEKMAATVHSLGAALPEYADFEAFDHDAGTDNAVAVGYHVRLPYGEGRVALGTKHSFNVSVIGKNCEIRNSPPFLEPLLEKGLSDLKKAAAGQGDIAGRLQKAGRYRAIRQGIVGTARLPKAKAAKLLEKHTPAGLSHAVIVSIINDADKAMKNLTAAPRRHGMIYGLSLAALLYAAYFLTPLRSMLTGVIANHVFHGAVDILLYVLGIFTVNFSAQIAGAHAMKKALARLVPAEKRNSMLAKTGHQLVLISCLCAVLFLVSLETSFHLAAHPPSWYAFIRSKIFH